MQSKAELKYLEIFELKEQGLKFSLDSDANLFWSREGKTLKELATLPWKFQLPFYLKFLHNDDLSECFKDLNILGAMDIYIKLKFFSNEPLEL